MLRTQTISFLSLPLLAAAVLAVGLGGASCDFDDRTLHAEHLGSAGEGGDGGDDGDGGSALDSNSSISATSSSAGGSSAGGSTASSAAASTTGSGGAGTTTATATSTGQPPPPPSTNEDCPDLDRNSVDDCDETLVSNAGFEANAEDWDAQAPVEFAWQGAGSTGGESGSVGVVLSTASDKRTMAGVSQCVEVDAGVRYMVYAQTLIRMEESSAALSLLFHDTSDCSGAHIDKASSTMLSASEHWGVLHMAEMAPLGTQSMSLRLAAVKEPEVESVEVRFDNVLVRAE